jgi:REP element-mobilizing transposase RayT
VILAFHCIFSTYGFWLPNEPRGSWSTFVASWELFRFGPAIKVETRRSVAGRSYDHGLKSQMRSALDHPPIVLSGEQARIVGKSMRSVPYSILALAILPEHVHAVIGHNQRDIRRVVGHIKSEATRSLRAAGWFAERSPWSDHGWNVYLDCDSDVRRSIEYVNNNPARSGLPVQRWSCVVPYDPNARRERRG